MPPGHGTDWDEDFAFIVGFTEGGAPFGVSWEEVDGAVLSRVAPAAPDEDEDTDVPF